MSLKLRVLPRLPARLLGTTGTTVIKANGVWTVKLDFAPLATVGSVAAADQATTYFVINRDASYYKISYSSLVADVATAVGGGLGFQPLDADLTALAALATTGFVERTGAATYALSTAINLAAQVTGTLPIANGGTAQTTAAGARGSSGLNVERYTGRGDADYTILNTDRVVGTTATLTAIRTFTLPAANALNAGQGIWVADFFGGVNGANVLGIARAGSDTINGGTSVTISVANGAYLLISDGTSKWSALAQGASAVAGVSTVFGRSGAVVAVAGDYTFAQLYNAVIPPQGRLTLTASTPVMLADAAAATTVRYTPYVGRFVPVWDGTRFVLLDIGGELTQATTDATKSPAAAAVSSNFDMFVWNDAGTPRCTRGPAWTSATSRGTGAGTTEIGRQNGVLVNVNAITNGPAALRGTYVGTIRTNASAQVDWILGGAASGGTAAVLGVWNYYNRVAIRPKVTDSGSSYTDTGGTVRQSRGSAGNQISFISGFDEDGISVNYRARCDSGTTAGNHTYWGIGFDSTTAFFDYIAHIVYNNDTAGGTAAIGTGVVHAEIPPQIGWHFIAACEQTPSGTSSHGAGSVNIITALLRM